LEDQFPAPSNDAIVVKLRHSYSRVTKVCFSGHFVRH
jgi:hypothetical protein